MVSWSPLFQRTIDAYAAGDLAAGRDACERILSTIDVPVAIELQTRRNLVFYAPQLEELAPRTVFHPITIPVSDGWSCHNPSIAADGERFRVIIRSANYTVDNQLRFTPTDSSGIVRTTNYIADLSPDFVIERVEVIDDRAFRPEPPPMLRARPRRALPVPAPAGRPPAVGRPESRSPDRAAWSSPAQ